MFDFSADRKITGFLVVALLALHSALLAWEGWRMSPTFDEVAHLAAGLSHWRFGRFDLYHVNPPLIRTLAASPLLWLNPETDWSGFRSEEDARPEFELGRRFAQANKNSIFWYFTVARWACIPVSLVGAYVCYRWARELYGTLAGLLSLTLWCLCPNILANAALITPDAGGAAFGVASGYFFWRWLREPQWTRALVAGLALGIAELTKSTWVVLFALWPALTIIWIFVRRATWRQSLLQLTTILLVGVYVLNMGYLFENSFWRLDRFNFISHTLGGGEAHDVPGNRFKGSWLGTLPVPLPANYVRGIDAQKYDFELGKWSYLRGEQKMGGWWYYYVYALGVKVPVSTLMLIVLAAVVWIRRLWSQGWKARIDDLVVLAHAILVLVLISSQTGFSRYLRYALPMFPFVFVWTGQIAQRISVCGNSFSVPCPLRATDLPVRWMQRDFRTAVIIVLLCWTAGSSLATVPHSLSYFNELVGGPKNGPRHLLDANVDWGQDLLEFKRWMKAHPGFRPLYFTYFGLMDPRIAGIDLPKVPVAAANSAPGPTPVASWYAISVNDLYGYMHDGWEIDKYAYLRKQHPVAHVGYSIVVFHSSVK